MSDESGSSVVTEINGASCEGGPVVFKSEESGYELDVGHPVVENSEETISGPDDGCPVVPIDADDGEELFEALMEIANSNSHQSHKGIPDDEQCRDNEASGEGHVAKTHVQREETNDENASLKRMEAPEGNTEVYTESEIQGKADQNTELELCKDNNLNQDEERSCSKDGKLTNRLSSAVENLSDLEQQLSSLMRKLSTDTELEKPNETTLTADDTQQGSEVFKEDGENEKASKEQPDGDRIETVVHAVSDSQSLSLETQDYDESENISSPKDDTQEPSEYANMGELENGKEDLNAPETAQMCKVLKVETESKDCKRERNMNGDLENESKMADEITNEEPQPDEVNLGIRSESTETGSNNRSSDVPALTLGQSSDQSLSSAFSNEERGTFTSSMDSNGKTEKKYLLEEHDKYDKDIAFSNEESKVPSGLVESFVHSNKTKENKDLADVASSDEGSNVPRSSVESSVHSNEAEKKTDLALAHSNEESKVPSGPVESFVHINETTEKKDLANVASSNEESSVPHGPLESSVNSNETTGQKDLADVASSNDEIKILNISPISDKENNAGNSEEENKDLLEEQAQSDFYPPEDKTPTTIPDIEIMTTDESEISENKSTESLDTLDDINHSRSDLSDEGVESDTKSDLGDDDNALDDVDDGVKNRFLGVDRDRFGSDSSTVSEREFQEGNMAEGADKNTSDRDIMSGHLLKLGGTGLTPKNWRKRWFVLKEDNCLYYYKAVKDPTPCGVIVLLNYSVSKAPEVNKRHCFKLNKGGARSYNLSAASDLEMKDWMVALMQAAANVSKPGAGFQILEGNVHNVSIPALSIRDPDCHGYLSKQGHKVKSWKRRYCVLKNGYLYYYSDMANTTALGVARLLGYTLEIGEAKGRHFCYYANAPDAAMRSYHFSAETETDRKRWMSNMEDSIKRGSHHES